MRLNHFSRRDVVELLGGAALGWPGVVQAQQRRVPVVGVLWHAGNAEEEGANFTALIEGFRNIGYVDGQNIRLEHRFPNEIPDRFRSMAAELVSLNVDVLVAVGNNAAPYAKDATGIVPVVFILVGDPIGLQLVDNFARPRGNVTGLSNFTAELIAKRLQLLKNIIPGLSRVALLANMNAKISGLYIDLSHAAAAQLGLTIQTFEVRSPNDLEPAFDAMTKMRMQALTTNADGLAFTQRGRIAKLAVEHRLPLGVWSREVLRAGALLSYGAESLAICRRTAVYVDRILKGAKPGDLPVEQASRFEFLINLKTARALGIELQPQLLAGADELIE